VPLDRPRMMTHFEEAVIDPQLNAVHAAMARQRACNGTLARLRMRCLNEGPQALGAHELAQLAQDGECLSLLHREAWRAPPSSYWGRLLDESRRRRDLAPMIAPAPTAAALGNHALA